jgi:ribosome-associated heat shock protein Hsp15
MQDCTSPAQLEILELARMAGNGGRDRGTGRPTKKDRRDIEIFMSEIDDWTNDDLTID